MIVWGGWDPGSGTVFSTGARYNLSTDSWAPTSTTNVPDARSSQTAVWTSSEMIIWGGSDENFVPLNSGGMYNPGTDSWIPTSTTSAPIARTFCTAVWTGSEMIIWGGSGASQALSTPVVDMIPTRTVGKPLASPVRRIHESSTPQSGVVMK